MCIKNKHMHKEYNQICEEYVSNLPYHHLPNLRQERIEHIITDVETD